MRRRIRGGTQNLPDLPRPKALRYLRKLPVQSISEKEVETGFGRRDSGLNPMKPVGSSRDKKVLDLRIYSFIHVVD